ncbi:hypothetical protein Ac2012v2_006173 [Leucoagaricus gongylophorus]
MPALHHSPPPPDTPPPAPSPRHKSAHPRRPLSPSCLRDVDLSHSDAHSRARFPAPPTGHELMALFPPPPPECGPEARGGPTSDFFQRQERAFFAQAGKEIIRVRVQVNLPPDQEQLNSGGPSPRSWHHPSPSSSALPSFSQRPPRSAQVFPLNSQPSPGLRTPPHDHPPPHDDYDDEAWRKPIPYAERRRAGKHTKRVIVRP